MSSASCYWLLLFFFSPPFDFSYWLHAVFTSIYSPISMLSAPMLGASVCRCSLGVLDHFWDIGVGTPSETIQKEILNEVSFAVLFQVWGTQMGL